MYDIQYQKEKERKRDLEKESKLDQTGDIELTPLKEKSEQVDSEQADSEQAGPPKKKGGIGVGMLREKN
jgi:hypothetical protein